MEDYEAAYHERLRDTQELDQAQRRLAALHWGGITVECFLKALVVAGRGISQWQTSDSPSHGVKNPGHDLKESVKLHNKLRNRFQEFPEAMKWLERIDMPAGHFIDLRYRSEAPNDAEYREWLHSYKRLLRWLQKQSTQI